MAGPHDAHRLNSCRVEFFARCIFTTVFVLAVRTNALIKRQDDVESDAGWWLGDMRVDAQHAYPHGARLHLDETATPLPLVDTGAGKHEEFAFTINATGETIASLNVRTIGTRNTASAIGACRPEVLPHRRIFLFTLVPPYHGSTALEGVLMSSPYLATLCSAGTWQCEGRSIMSEAGFDNVGGWDYSKMLNMYSRFWNLSLPVLLEKTPQQFSFVRTERMQLMSTKLPSPFINAGVFRLRLAYILMWRPPCLAELSTHAGNHDATWARMELSQLEKLMDAHQFLASMNAPVLVINFASLIWYPLLTVQRLEVFLPCLGPMNADFVPQLGVDIMEANEWKAQGSVRDFGASIDPGSCRYNVISHSCPALKEEPGFSELTEEEQAKATEAIAYLRSHS